MKDKNNKKLGTDKKLKFLLLRKNNGFKFNHIELYTNGLSIFAKPKTIFPQLKLWHMVDGNSQNPHDISVILALAIKEK